MTISNIPTGAVNRESSLYNTTDELLQMLPNGTAQPMAEKSVSDVAVTNVQLSSGGMVVITSEDYGCYYRFKTATDTDDVTGGDGGNALGKCIAGSQRVEAVVDGATHISVLGNGGTATVTIEQRA